MVLKWCPSPQKRPIKSNIKIREISTVREVTKRDSQHCGAAASAEVRAMHVVRVPFLMHLRFGNCGKDIPASPQTKATAIKLQ